MTHTDHTTDQNSITLKKAEKLVFNAVKKQGKDLTKSEIQVQTGLSLFHVEDSLEILMAKFSCRLHVSEKGELIYDFDLSKPREKKSIFDYVLQAAGFIKKLILFVFKLLTTLVFIVYFGFWGLLIAVIITGLAKNLYGFVLWGMSLFYALKLLVLELPAVFTGKQVRISKKRSLIESVIAYAIGEQNRKADKLAIEKHIIGYLQNNEMKITAGEVVAITGWSVQKCEEELTRMLTHYNGEVYVTQEAAIVYDFSKLKTENDVEKKENQDFYIWNNPHRYKNWNENSRFINNTITAIATISLLIAAIVVIFNDLNFSSFGEITSTLFTDFDTFWNTDMVWLFAFGCFPFMFFSVFLLFSNITRIITYWKNHHLRKQNQYFKTLRLIFANLPAIKAEKLQYLSEKEQEKLRYRNYGETEVADDATVYYRFNHLFNEIMAVNKERSTDFQYQGEHFDKQTKVKQRKYKGRRKSLRVFFKTLIVGIVLVLIPFWYIVYPLLNAKLGLDDKIVIHLNRKLHYKWIKPSELRRFKHIDVYNISSRHPFHFAESMPFLRSLVIRNAEKDAFTLPKKMPFLEELIIENTKITELPQEISQSKRLSILKISNNELVALPDSLHHTKVFTLQADNNKITKIPEELVLCEDLSQISLKNNRITELPEKVFPKSLFSLHLDSNQIRRLPGVLPDVSYLSLGYNLIDTLIISGVDSLEIPGIQLNNNRLKAIPPDLFNIRRVSNINVSYNEITALPDSIHAQGYLQQLDLAHNKLRTLPVWISKLESIRKLNLENNPIDNLPDELSTIQENHRYYYRFRVIIEKDIPKERYEMFCRIFGEENIELAE